MYIVCVRVCVCVCVCVYDSIPTRLLLHAWYMSYVCKYIVPCMCVCVCKNLIVMFSSFIIFVAIHTNTHTHKHTFSYARILVDA